MTVNVKLIGAGAIERFLLNAIIIANNNNYYHYYSRIYFGFGLVFCFVLIHSSWNLAANWISEKRIFVPGVNQQLN